MSEIIINGQPTEQPESPKIEFPCDYPVKIMGEAEVDFIEFVLEVITRHDSSFDGQHEVKTSRNGRYHSVTVVITATGELQLRALHQELMGSGRVKMVL